MHGRWGKDLKGRAREKERGREREEGKEEGGWPDGGGKDELECRRSGRASALSEKLKS